MNPTLIAIALRYAVSALGTVLASKNLLEPDQINTLQEQLLILSGAIVALVPVIWGMWREPSKPALEAAKQVDKGNPVIVQGPKGGKTTIYPPGHTQADR